MNRIILIGNGFDLAHNLNTSYKSFIEWVWIKISTDLFEAKIEWIKTEKFTYKKVTDPNKLVSINDSNIQRVNGLFCIVKDGEPLYKTLTTNNSTTSEIKEYIEIMPIHYENFFLEKITEEYQHQTWADIEQIYYEELLTKDKEDDIKKLNEDFNAIKELLKEYLSSLDQPEIIPELVSLIKSPILYRDISNLHIDNYKKDLIEIYKKYADENGEEWVRNIAIASEKHTKIISLKILRNLFIDDLLTEETSQEYNDDLFHNFLSPDHVYFLSFNYTDTECLYSADQFPYKTNITNKYIASTAIYIHGELEDEKNPMIFGYGDEHDEGYKTLENPKRKGALNNMKSMKYLLTPNYRKVESIINSDLYQVLIMGHSCGLTDNTLLKTIFEHPNCASIKPYYYVDPNENDNYNEIIQSISRCFSDKSKLRSIVVNKEFCIKLAQATK